ncbi:MAG: redoxin domain-containing protein [Dehalococcoidia bacterium]|nr:redoxin domain-containing protein [Dehalococcoidia bacterium]
MLEVGTAAPDFTASQVTGGEFTLSDLWGSNVVLYFFLRAFTRG